MSAHADDLTAGLIMMAAGVLAMLAANSPLAEYYSLLEGRWPTLIVNDGLMALFFLGVGLEIRREAAPGGELSQVSGALLPCVAALGGVAAPALIFHYFNRGLPGEHGWAIPTATDIAFSLGVLALLKGRVPHALRMFLMAVAVMDDLVAVTLIALFYGGSLNVGMLLAVLLGLAAILLCARYRVTSSALYASLGLMLWADMLASGIHPTIAGVALGLLLPLELNAKWLAALRRPLMFVIVPLFAFTNAGLPLSHLGGPVLTSPVTVGVMAGLILGKPLGIAGTAWLLGRLRMARPPGSGAQLLGIGLLGGIGFTMSLFIAALAFGEGGPLLPARLGIAVGSLVSAVLGYILLHASTRAAPARQETA